MLKALIIRRERRVASMTLEVLDNSGLLWRSYGGKVTKGFANTVLLRVLVSLVTLLFLLVHSIILFSHVTVFGWLGITRVVSLAYISRLSLILGRSNLTLLIWLTGCLSKLLYSTGRWGTHRLALLIIESSTRRSIWLRLVPNCWALKLICSKASSFA